MLLWFGFVLLASLLWHMHPWQTLQQYTQRQLAKQGLTLHVKAWHINGLGVQLEHPSLSGSMPGMPLHLNTVTIRPDWQALVHARAGLQLKLEASTGKASCRLIWLDDSIQLSDIDLQLVASVLQPWLITQGVPWELGGEISIRGTVKLSVSNAYPQNGMLDVEWRQAALHMPGLPDHLGDYHVRIEYMESGWHWLLQGGAAIALQGRGIIKPRALPLQQWPLQGTLIIRQENTASILPKALHLDLSGILARPQYRDKLLVNPIQ